MDRSLFGVFPAQSGQAVSGAGGGTVYAEIRPPVGELWIVDAASMLHDDDAAARILFWTWYNGVTSTVLWQASVAIALNTFTDLYGNVRGANPFVCSYDSYLRAGAVSLVAGHVVAANYLVRRIRGVEPFSST